MSKAVELMPVFSREAFGRAVNYPVMVECWLHKDYGRGRRMYREAFTQAERKAIARYYTKFYRWYLMTEAPEQVMLRPKTFVLLQRAVDFFAST